MVHAILNFLLHNGKIDEDRENLYTELNWTQGDVPLEELGIWDKAQGLPHKYCTGTVVETAKKLTENPIGPVDKVMLLSLLPVDPTLDTIIIIDGNLRRGRENCEKTKYTIDDGCMRSLAYAIKGRRKIRAHIGKVPSNNPTPLFLIWATNTNAGYA